MPLCDSKYVSRLPSPILVLPKQDLDEELWWKYVLSKQYFKHTGFRISEPQSILISAGIRHGKLLPVNLH